MEAIKVNMQKNRFEIRRCLSVRRVVPVCLLLLTAIITACKEDNAGSFPSASDTGNISVPKVKLQRVFNKIRFDAPLVMTQAPGNDAYWYVLEKEGRILKVENKPDVEKAEVFLDITDRVDASNNEGGFLGMVFHPQYEQNKQVFLSYTRSGSPLVSYITRVISSDNGKSLSPESEKIILTVEQPYSNHNGGNILFGPDGYLYIGLGDGGSGGDPLKHGQNTGTLLGALLRIDINSDGDKPYAIPDSNPFKKAAGKRGEIFAWGLRNPWRWSFDRATGKIWLADVGQNSWEEINVISGPGNFGWNKKEGTHCYQTRGCENPDFIEPVAEYNHDYGCSVTGGYVYRGDKVPSLKGLYLFGDFCSGIVWATTAEKTGPDNSNQYHTVKLLETGMKIASFAEGNDGEVYLLDIGGEIHQFVGN